MTSTAPIPPFGGSASASACSVPSYTYQSKSDPCWLGWRKLPGRIYASLRCNSAKKTLCK